MVFGYLTAEIRHNFLTGRPDVLSLVAIEASGFNQSFPTLSGLPLQTHRHRDKSQTELA